jgi:chloramphenicol 3-O phosphotransferase
MFYKYIILFALAILSFYLFWKKSIDSSVGYNQKSGKVVILNGPSAAGKSSIQAEFQKLMMPNLWIKVGIDNLFDKPMPDITIENLDFWQNKNEIRWVSSEKDLNDNSVITLHVGKQGLYVVQGMNRAIAEYAKSGCNVIVDYIGYDPKWLEDLKQQLKGVKTYWVKVEIPLEVLEKREEARATSPKGHARSHFDKVYGNIGYDLVVNSDKDSAMMIAENIKKYFSL